jgi:hypothetical protein
LEISIHHNRCMRATGLHKGITLALFAAVGLSAVYWGGRIWQSSQPVQVIRPVQTSLEPTVRVDERAMLKALGGNPGSAPGPVASAAGRFALKGLVSSAGGGAALIATEVQAAKPYLAGQMVQAPYRLVSVDKRQALLKADGSAEELRLDLPALSASDASRR